MLETVVGCVTVCSWLVGIWFYPRCLDATETCIEQHCILSSWIQSDNAQPSYIIDEAEAHYANGPMMLSVPGRNAERVSSNESIPQCSDSTMYTNDIYPLIVPANIMSSPIVVTSPTSYSIPIAKLIKID